MTFENHLRSACRGASQRFSFLEEFWQVFHDRSLLGTLSGFCPVSFGVLFCSVVLGCRYTLKLLDLVVNGARFITGEGVFECDIAHRRSVAVLCMLYKIRCNRMHPLYGALPVPYVLWSHIGTLMSPRCITLRYLYSFLSVLVERTIFVTLNSTVWDWLVSRASPMLFYWP